MARLYIRETTVTVNDVQVVNDRTVAGLRVPGLRINFDVTRDLKGKTNRVLCNIFNLKEATRNKMAVDKPIVEIEAGYTENFGVIFAGTGTQVTSEKTATGYVTAIEGKDGFRTLTRFLNESFAPNIPFQTVLLAVVNSLGVDVTQAKLDINAGIFTTDLAKQGYVLSGRADKLLDGFAKTFDFTWSIQNNELIMVLRDEAVVGSAILLTPTTGLVGSPLQILDEKRPNIKMIKGRSLLHPGIIPGRRLLIEASQAEGIYKVNKIQHRGDTHGDDWHTNFEAQEIS